MPDNRTISYYAMYVIGEVESNWDWTGVNYNDPITIGMMQWYGTRAAGLLERVKNEMPGAYTELAQSLRNDMDAHPAYENWWTTKYLTQNEGNSIIAVFSQPENHIIQENQAIADFEGYIELLSSWGMSTANPKPLVFAMSMYHQSPRQCGYVISSAGANADLDRLYSTCLNDGVLGVYRNRYTTVYNRLKAWDGESMPPDFGQVGTNPSEGGNEKPITGQSENEVGWIIGNGENLVLYGDNDKYRKGVLFARAGADRWIPAVNKSGAPIDGGHTGGGTSASGQAVVDWMAQYMGQWSYGLGAPGRLTPQDSRVTDCSGAVWAAYWFAAGVELGDYTGTQCQNGVEIWRGYGWAGCPWDSMKPGDLVLMSRDDNGFTFPAGSASHIELYTGEGSNTLGCGTTPCPHINDIASWYGRTSNVMIRRVFND